MGEKEEASPQGAGRSRRPRPSPSSQPPAPLPGLAGHLLGDLGDALVGLGRGHEAGQTAALVGALRVGAAAVLTQGHAVADVLALVDVCGGAGDGQR